MRTIENDIPEAFLELAKEGISLGLSEVELGFYYVGADFVSPVDWALWLTKRRVNADEMGSVVISMQRGEDEPRAYIPEQHSGVPMGEYWGLEQVRAWLREPLPELNEHFGVWTPQEEPSVQEELLKHWPLFLEGAKSGWTVKHTANWSDLNFARRMGHTPPKVPGLTLNWDITNSFYNTSDHPDNRNAGAPLSIGGWFVSNDGYEQIRYRGVEGGDDQRLISREELEALLSATAPWFVRVADNDEEEEEWVHFPEADSRISERPSIIEKEAN